MMRRAHALWRAGAGASVLAVCLVWVWAGAAPWWSERLTAAAQEGGRVPERLASLLWADAPARVAARRLLLEGLEAEEAEAERLLAQSVRARPLYAPTWLARARLALRRGEPERAAAYADLSTQLWPRRSRHQWNLAMLRIEMGDRDGAFRALRAHQRARATGIERLLWIAERIEPDPERAGARLLPDPDWTLAEKDAYLTQLLAVAAREERIALVRAAWEALSETARAKPATVRAYVETLLSAGLEDEAVAAWNRYWRGEGDLAAEPITNAGFEDPLALGGLGWTLHTVPGVEWRRDARVRFAGSFSLEIDFESREDLAYRQAFQWVPVEAGRRYRLSGRWRGADVATPSGPYLEVASYDPEPPFIVKGRPRTGSWEWSAFEIDFRAPDDVRLVKIRVRRDRARVPDAGISGRLWIDDLRLQPLESVARDG